MRARRFRPSFETLTQRITPSDVAPVGAAVLPAAVATTTISAMPTSDGTLPGETTNVLNNLGEWQVSGDPQDTPVCVEEPPVDPTAWVFVTS